MTQVKFISAQPDTTYFHWQVEVMLENFTSVGVDPKDIIVLFAYRDFDVSLGVKNLKKKYPEVGIFYYKNEVRNSKGYVPVLRPHVLAKHFERYPELNNFEFFYHDCDIILRDKIDFSLLSEPNTCYVSDTNSYISESYIREKSDKHIERMCNIVGITQDLPEKFTKHSGGAQYLLKGIDSEFWRKVERDCVELYDYFKIYEDNERKTLTEAELVKYNPIQKWCADMWAVLWNVWYYGKDSQVHPELEFTWPNDSLEKYERTKIYHNAGVTSDKEGLFYKSKYQNKSPFDEDFSHIKTNVSTIKYVEAIKRVKNKQATI